jgi:hypothetical protein
MPLTSTNTDSATRWLARHPLQWGFPEGVIPMPTHANPDHQRRRTARAATPASPLALHSHLTDRDRRILAMLDEHQVLTAGQLHRLFFTGLRTCQLRLGVLRGLDLLDRFRYARPWGGTEQWKWVLGWTGAQFQAAASGRRPPTERTWRDQTMRLTASPTLPHLLTTNEFFVRLHHTARTQPGVQPGVQPGAQPGAQLLRWWSEPVTARRFNGIHPDGHGIWTAPQPGHRPQPHLGAAHPRSSEPPVDSPVDSLVGRPGEVPEQLALVAVGFFLECDTGSENLARLVGKLDAYARLAATGGPRYPVLFWLPNAEREDNLRRVLRGNRLVETGAVPVATATHDTDPAGPVWLPATDRPTDGRRVPLAELPASHGPRSATNPNWRDGHLDLSDQRHPYSH